MMSPEWYLKCCRIVTAKVHALSYLSLHGTALKLDQNFIGANSISINQFYVIIIGEIISYFIEIARKLAVFE